MRQLEDWIDFMEGETDAKTTGKLNLLLKHSSDDKMVFDNLTRLRRYVKLADLSEGIEEKLSSKEFNMNFQSGVIDKLKKSKKIQQEDPEKPQSWSEFRSQS